MVEHDNRIRVRVEYVVLGGSESYYNYSMFWSDREESFLVFPRTPDWSGLAVNVYIRCKHRYRGEVESMIRIMEEYLNVSVLNVYYPQEGFSDGNGDVANQYPSKVEKYERPDAAALDCLRRQEVTLLVTGLPKLTTFRWTRKLTIIRSPECQFHKTRVSSCS